MLFTLSDLARSPDRPALMSRPFWSVRTTSSAAASITFFRVRGSSSQQRPSEQTSEAPALCLIYTDHVADDIGETVNRLKTRWPFARTVLLSDHWDPAAVTHAFQAGLDGLCPTAMRQDALILALELVVLGERFIPAEVGLALLNAQPRGYEAGFGVSAAAVPANDGLGGKSLSGREAQILHLITQGAANKVIARELGLAEATVKVHVKAILRKVKVSNRTQAAMWAQQHLKGRPQDAIMDAAE